MNKGNCAECGLRVSVRKDGLLAPHLWSNSKPRGCPGGYQFSDEEVFENAGYPSRRELHDDLNKDYQHD